MYVCTSTVFVCNAHCFKKSPQIHHMYPDVSVSQFSLELKSSLFSKLDRPAAKNRNIYSNIKFNIFDRTTKIFRYVLFYAENYMILFV